MPTANPFGVNGAWVRANTNRVYSVEKFGAVNSTSIDCYARPAVSAISWANVRTLKSFRRIATRYDKLAWNLRLVVLLAATKWWLN